MLLLQFFESLQLSLVISSLGWLDVVLGVIFIWGLVVGYMRGLTHQLPRLCALLITIVLTFHYYERVSEIVVSHSSLSPHIVTLLTFFLFCIAIHLVVRLVFAVIMKLITVQFVYFLERIVGGCAGAFRFILFFSLVSYFVNMFSIPLVTQIYNEQSVCGKSLLALCPSIYDFSIRMYAALYNGIFSSSAV